MWKTTQRTEKSGLNERSLTKYSEVVALSYLDYVRFVVVTNTSFREKWSTSLPTSVRVSKPRKAIQEEVFKQESVEQVCGRKE